MPARRPAAGIALLIVADDLTGALDCACEAGDLGLRAAVFRTPEALADAVGRQPLPPVVAVSTGSRDGGKADAVAAVQRVAGCLAGLAPGRVMKKVDSRLKGHAAAETAALAAALGIGRLLLAPAIPDMGRVQRDGQLSGFGLSAPIDIAARFALPGGAAPACAVPDILQAADFDRVAAAAPNVLPVGARGLAQALLRRLWPAAVPRRPDLPAAPALFVVGSRDPITLAQVARLRTRPDIDCHAAPDGLLPDPGPQARPLRLLQTMPGSGPGPDQPTGAVAQRLAAAAAGLLWRQPVPVLLGCGGETADAVLAALGAGRMDVRGTALPGIGLSVTELDGGRRLHILTKSGGFGDPDTLDRLATMLTSVAPVRTTRGRRMAQNRIAP